MQDLPHHYRCIATANADQSRVSVASQGLDDLTTDVPKEFGGPGDQWSPEALLVAAVADCFVLTFRAVTGPSQITWHALDCDAKGTLERVDRSTQFTRIELSVRISVPEELEEEKILRVLKKSRGHLPDYQFTQCNDKTRRGHYPSISLNQPPIKKPRRCGAFFVY